MNLENLTVSQEELNSVDLSALESMDSTGEVYTGEGNDSLKFDESVYAPLDAFVEGIRNLPKKPKRVSNSLLSVNGKVISDRMDLYLAKPHLSSSLLKEVLKSPRHYLLAKNTPELRKQSKSFNFGTFAHSAILELSKFDKVHIRPTASRAEKSGVIKLIEYFCELLAKPMMADYSEMKMPELKSMLAELESEAEWGGLEFVSEEQMMIIDVFRGSLRTYGDGIIPHMMKYAKVETSFYTTDISTGLKVRIRPDAVLLEENFGGNYILSVKTTSAGSVDEFMRDSAKYKYELSEGMYLKVASEVTGRNFAGTVVLMVQNVLPYQVALIYYDAEDLEVGKYKYVNALDSIANCYQNNVWLGFDSLAEEGNFGIIQGKLPAYIKQELKPQQI